MPLMALFNRKERALSFMDGNREIGVWVYRAWFGGRVYATAAWPFIYVPDRPAARSIKLMHHEHRHIQQQCAVGGLLFLLTYGLSFIVLLPFKKFNWYEAYLAIPWEVDARKYAEKMMKHEMH